MNSTFITFLAAVGALASLVATAFIISNHFKLKKIMADLTALQQEVAENTSVVQSAVTFIQGIKQQLDEAGTDPQKLADLSAQLDQNSQALAAAIASNTPGDETGGTGGASGSEA